MGEWPTAYKSVPSIMTDGTGTPMTDTADLVKELDNLHKHSKSRDAPVRASSVYYHSFISGVYKAWPSIKAHIEATQARAESAESSLAAANERLATLRNEVLEEAAKVADDYGRDGSLTKAYECETADELAARIRALKTAGKE